MNWSQGVDRGRKENRQLRTSGLQLHGPEGQEVLQSLLREHVQSAIRHLRVRAYGVCCRGSSRGSGVGVRALQTWVERRSDFCDVDCDATGLPLLTLKAIRRFESAFAPGMPTGMPTTCTDGGGLSGMPSG